MSLKKGIYLELSKSKDGYHATLRFLGDHARANGGAAEGVSVSGFSWHSITHAIKRAASIAKQVVSNPMVASLLPPGVGTAVQVVDKLTDLAHSGDLNKTISDAAGIAAPMWQHFDNPAIRAIAAKLAAASAGKTVSVSGCHCLVSGDTVDAMMGRRPHVRAGRRFHRGRRYRRGGANLGPGGWFVGPVADYEYDEPVEPALGPLPAPPPIAPAYPSPYFARPMRPSWGMPSNRPISFRDAYGRIYGPQNRRLNFRRWPL